MRLNRGTIIFVVVLLAIIAAALVINNTSQPTATATPQATDAVARVFPDLDGARAVRIEITDNQTGVSTTLTRDPSFLWSVVAAGATAPTQNRVLDQVAVPGFLNSFAQLTSTESFQNDQLQGYGLQAPAHTVTMTTDDGGVYTLHIGNTNLAGNRYFAIAGVTTGSGAPAPTAVPTIAEEQATAVPQADFSATPTATPFMTATPGASPTPTATATPLVTLAGALTVYLVPKTEVDALIGLIQEPPYLPLPTATSTPFPTANPFSEVEQTATAAVQQTATSTILTLTATSAVTATPEAAVSTPEATPEGAAQATAVPVTQAPSNTPMPSATNTVAPTSTATAAPTNTRAATTTPRP